MERGIPSLNAGRLSSPNPKAGHYSPWATYTNQASTAFAYYKEDPKLGEGGTVRLWIGILCSISAAWAADDASTTRIREAATTEFRII